MQDDVLRIQAWSTVYVVTNCPMQAMQDMWSKDSANGFVKYN